MGPHGSWYNWTIKNNKIYFFWFNTAKNNFLVDSEKYILMGDERWASWYPDNSTAVITTRCVETTPDPSESKIL